jgi:hypothetical protein
MKIQTLKELKNKLPNKLKRDLSWITDATIAIISPPAYFAKKSFLGSIKPAPP